MVAFASVLSLMLVANLLVAPFNNLEDETIQ